MEAKVASAPRYCDECGTVLLHGRCPMQRNARNSRATFLAIAAAATSLIGMLAISIGIAQHARRDRANMSKLRAGDEAIAVRLTALEAATRKPDSTSIITRTQAAVFTVEVGAGLGSAFVARSGKTSTLITAFHVVEDAYRHGSTIRVRSANRTYEARIMRVSLAEDLATISVDAELSSLPLARQRPKVGDGLLVVGSPLGLAGSVTEGIVSAIREGALQFSAAVSPGNSGGPVLATNGEVIGVVVSKWVGEGAEGLSFAAPIQVACETVLTC